MCFVLQSDVHQSEISRGQVASAVAAGAIDYETNPPNTDPGPAAVGWNLTVSSGSVTVTRISDSTVVGTNAVTGTASIEATSSPGTIFTVSALDLSASGTHDVDASADAFGGGSGLYTEASLTIPNIWTGSLSWPSGTVTIASSAATAQIAWDKDDAGYSSPVNPTADITGTWTPPDGGTPTLTLSGTFSDGTYDYAFALSFTAASRPSATITAPPVQSPAPDCTQLSPCPEAAWECTSPAGVSFDATSSVSTGAAVHWTLGIPNVHFVGDAGTDASVYGTLASTDANTSFQLPLNGHLDPPLVLSLNATAEGLETVATRLVRAVDTTAPTPTENGLVFDFGCGPSRIRNIYDDLCRPRRVETAQYVANLAEDAATDVCDTNPTIHVTAVYAYDELGTQIQSTDCSTLPVPSSDPSIRYDVVWHAEDSWGNQSSTQRSRVTVTASATASECSGATHYKSFLVWTGNNGSQPSFSTIVMGSWDFSLMTPGAITMPTGLSFSRASSATVQTSDHNVAISAITTNTARVGNDATNHEGHFGLLVEEARTNLIANSRDLTGTGWFTGMYVTTTTAVQGVDGTNAATRSHVSSNGFSNYVNSSILTTGGKYAFSEWVRNNSGSGPFQTYVNRGGTATFLSNAYLPSQYQRVFNVGTAASVTFSVFPGDGYNETSSGGLAAGERDTWTDLIQLEAGSFPTEAIVTAGSTATRAGERVYASSGSSLLDGGRLNFEARIQPEGARGDYPGYAYLWSANSGAAYATIWGPTGTLYISNGSAYTTVGPISWNAGDTVDFYVGVGGGLSTAVSYRVNDGPVQTYSGTALSSWSVSGALDILCNGTGSQLSSHVQQVRAWKTGQYPVWAQ